MHACSAPQNTPCGEVVEQCIPEQLSAAVVEYLSQVSVCAHTAFNERETVV